MLALGLMSGTRKASRRGSR
ncbi:hypothetical protein G6L26_004285 [Agrobacterium radiobacter]|uniref:Uncharacterized protein n=1 Tax=Agrobacterium radiobacter TaxID=362 RepID=A0ABD5LPP4_AGRRD